MVNFRKRRGFTIVEILVVIAVISLLVSVSYVAFDIAKVKGRDLRRKDDLRTISSALISYYQDKDAYPPSSGVGTAAQYASDGTDPWIPDLTSNYIPKLPKDPAQASLTSNLANLFSPEMRQTGQSLLDFFAKNQPITIPTQVAQSVSFSPGISANTTDGDLTYSKTSNPSDYTGTCTAADQAGRISTGQRFSGGTYSAYRGYLTFQTSSIPDDAIITSATLVLSVVVNNATASSFTLQVRNSDWQNSLACPPGGSTNGGDWRGSTGPTIGQPTDTLVGTMTFNSTLPAFRAPIQITINDFSAINKAGLTSFMLTSDREELNTAPTGDEYFQFSSANDPFPAIKPQLAVGWNPQPPPAVLTSPASDVTTSSATLNGRAKPLGAITTAWFRFFTNNPHVCNDTFGTRVPSTGGTDLGTGTDFVNFSQPVSFLIPGTTYYYCAIAQNSAGKSMGQIVSFTTVATVCAGKKNVYCYVVSGDRTYYVIWAQLDKTTDPEAVGQPNTVCNLSPPDTPFNFCIEAPK